MTRNIFAGIFTYISISLFSVCSPLATEPKIHSDDILNREVKSDICDLIIDIYSSVVFIYNCFPFCKPTYNPPGRFIRLFMIQNQGCRRPPTKLEAEYLHIHYRMIQRLWRTQTRAYPPIVCFYFLLNRKGTAFFLLNKHNG